MVRQWALVAVVLAAGVGHSVALADGEWLESPGGELTEEQLAAARDAMILRLDQAVTLTDEQKQNVRYRLEVRDKAYLDFFSKNKAQLRELALAERQALKEDSRTAALWYEGNEGSAFRKAAKAYRDAVAPMRRAWEKVDADLVNEVLTPEQQAAWRKPIRHWRDMDVYEVQSRRSRDLSDIDAVATLSDLQKRKMYDVWAAVDKATEEITRRIGELREVQDALLFDEEGEWKKEIDHDKLHEAFRELNELDRQRIEHILSITPALAKVLTSEQKLALKTDKLAMFANMSVKPFVLDAEQIDKLKPHFPELMESEVFGLPYGWPDGDMVDKLEKRMREKARALLNENQRYEVERADAISGVRLWYANNGIWLTIDQHPQMEALYDDLARLVVTKKQIGARLAEESIRLLTDGQKNAMIKGAYGFGHLHRAALSPEVKLTDEQKKQLEAVDEARRANRDGQLDAFASSLSVEQRDEILHNACRAWYREKEAKEE